MGWLAGSDFPNPLLNTQAQVSCLCELPSTQTRSCKKQLRKPNLKPRGQGLELWASNLELGSLPVEGSAIGILRGVGEGG